MRRFKRQKPAPFQRNCLFSAALAWAASARDRGGSSRWLQVFRLQFRLRSRCERTANQRGVCTSVIRKVYGEPVFKRMFHTDFLRMGGTGYQPVLVGNLPTRLGRAPCRDEEMRREKF